MECNMFGKRPILALILIASASCNTVKDVTPATIDAVSKIKSDAPMGGYYITLTTSHDRYNASDSIDLRVELRNTGRRELAFGIGSSFPYDVDVLGPDGGPAARTQWGRRPSASFVASEGSHRMGRLAAGAVVEDDLSMLNREFDMTLDGQYTITVRRRFSSELDSSAEIEVFSNPVVIRIGP
jgi:hypothetical protein